MKRFGLAMLVLALGVMPSAVLAQSISEGVQANVPFAFVAGDQTIPAGKCLVRVEGLSKGALSIVNTEAKASSYVVPSPTESLAPAEKTVLVFHKYGSTYFLSRIQRSGSTEGYQLRETKVEKELRAKNASPIQMVRLEAE